MPIVLKKVQRTNPIKKDVKWYAVQKTLKQLTENEVAKRIADETTLNPSEALMAIRQLRKVVQQALLDGQSVRLGDWGSFYAAITSVGAETEKSLTAKSVKQVKINFKPGSELKAAMQTASYVWAEDLAGGSATDSSASDSTTSGGSASSGSGDDSNPL